MIFSIPTSTPDLQKHLAELSELRESLGEDLKTPGRWIGSLRRAVRAAAIESSTSIEGFSVSPEEALALTSGREAADGDDENRLAVSCYARAMDHVGVMADDPSFRWTDRVVLDLHFDACYFRRDKDLGHWRIGPILVTGPGGSVDYRGPDSDEVVPLMAEVVEWLEGGDLDADDFVRAAMAHLNLISIHPFRDGNGRVSRIVQSLVLARAGLASPEFFSIQEYLGAHTQEYYAALRETQGAGYQPDRDASGWVDFCVRAHIAQAKQRLAQIDQAATRWARLEELVSARGWPERLVLALEQSLYGGTDRSSYAAEADVSSATASADLRRLVDADLVVQQGRGRSVSYAAAERLLGAVAAR